MTTDVRMIEFHILQSLPPSCVNADETGGPKRAQFGGWSRLRVSSQSWNRATRLSEVFSMTVAEPLAVRTRRVVSQVSAQLTDLDEEQAQAVAQVLVGALLGKLDNGTGQTNVTMYIAPEEIDHLAATARAYASELLDEDTCEETLKVLCKEWRRRFKGRTSAPDLATFGRMMAENPYLTMPSAVQVAPALGVGSLDEEMDYFTAMDDLAADDEPGAGMIGDSYYASDVVYRYSNVLWQQLVDNLHGDLDLARRTVEGYTRATLASVPQGGQTRWAHNTLPGCVLAVGWAKGGGVSLVNAFETPVRPRGRSGLLEPSIDALCAEWATYRQAYQDIWGSDSLAGAALWLADGDLEVPGSLADAKVPIVGDLLSTVMGWLPAG